MSPRYLYCHFCGTEKSRGSSSPINLPYEMAMIYGGTTIGDGEESFTISQSPVSAPTYSNSLSEF